MSCIATCSAGTYADRTTDPNNFTCIVILKKKKIKLFHFLKKKRLALYLIV